ncbi:MAG TPA: 5'/3'-nucleotidase SurE [Thermoleophilia bacterium]|nr:5'/3'-nucleotidase SurE [Thermoleophilia bacterium]
MARILLTNDDGIHASGIAALRRALEGLGDVLTIAPRANMSAVARGITIGRPLRPRPASFGGGFPGLALDGTPSDCVRVGLTGVYGPPPDLVVSGVNLGGNMGVDVAYSGTVAAALEAVVRGLPGLAFSVEEHAPGWLDEAVPLLRAIVVQALEHGLPAATALNVNLPDRPLADIRAPRVTRLGGASCHDRLLLAVDGDGHGAVTEYPVPCDRAPAEHWAATDFEAVAAGHVSITPLTYELFAETALELLSAWELDLDLLRA